MAEPKTVRARWVGPFACERGPGTTPLNYGDEADVTPAEAESAHWEPVKGAKAKTEGAE
jgi:hypothetical protein